VAGNFQDDIRESAMRELFGLYKDESEGRSGVDAYLDIDGKIIPFELKTTSKGSVTTVRDFGLEHIKKWKDQHWLIGFFVGGREYYKYGSPKMMSPWIQEKQKYIAPDFKLANFAAAKLDLNDMYRILERKEKYTYEDAKRLHKMQYTKEEYINLQDLDGGYSPHRMLDIMKDRAKYLIERGSTLNNPHVPFKYFNDWVEITENHAEELKRLVKFYYEEEQ
jgi:hypothetical protein